MKRLGVLLLAVLTAALIHARPAPAGETEFADPPPSMEAPRRIVLALNSKDPAKINGVLSNAVNVQKYYEMDNVELAIVAYGPGIRAVLKGDSPVPDRIQSLITYGIEIIACRNTLETLHRPVEDLIEGVDHVKAGIPEIVERQLRGWIYVNP